MRKSPQRFTKNKDTVRTLQRNTIRKYLADKLGRLRYFGLPSSTLGDARAWEDDFAEFVAVERGERGKEWELQHDLEFQAFRVGLFGKVRQFRGDIDSVIRKGRDQIGNKVPFPFDVVSLDYSGGLFYRDEAHGLCRLKAIATLIEQQSKSELDFVLLISCNLDQIDQGEVRRTLMNIGTDLVRYGLAGEKVIRSYLAHEREEAHLKLYLPYFVNQEAAKHHYNCETSKVIFYAGNRKVRMMAFRFFLRFDIRTESLRAPQERLSQLINKPLIEIIDGKVSETLLGLPKLTAPETRRDVDGQETDSS